MAETRDTLARCVGWVGRFRAAVGEKDALLASTEFSASTHSLVRLSCTDAATLRMSYTMQLQAARAAGVELFAWTWIMPFGGAFRPAWSTKHMLHLLGVPGIAADTRSDICG